ncbi:MAG: D-aminoacyl-tRNA deacylase [Phycisphaerales bacterium JB039]
MRAIVQRVNRASVSARSSPDAAMMVAGAIDRGLLLLVGVQAGDTKADAERLAGKIAALRIFEDAQGRMNLAAGDVGGAILAIPNFTVACDVGKGRRPSFDRAAPPQQAAALFDAMVTRLRDALPVATGVFGAEMAVESVNDGPVTFIVESRRAAGPAPE